MHSHPARVLLQLRHDLPCRSTASVRTDLARIRTRGGCSYNYGTPSPVGAPPDRRTAPARTDLARIRTRGGGSYNHGTTSPCRRPAGSPDRPGANRSGAHSHPARVLLRLWHDLAVGAPPSVRTPPRPNPLLNLKPDGPLPATLPRARTWQRSCD